MLYCKARSVIVACSVAAGLLAMPAESHAMRCLSWLFGGCGPSTTYYAPAPYAGYYPQTCQYVPQTCYRTVYRSVPVTTCRAFSGCDPCTGCPVTTYRPVTSWACRPVQVPYTTYRVVYSNPCAPCVGFGGCAPCGPSASCGSCAGGACPATTYYSGSIISGTSGCATCIPSTSTVTTQSSLPPATSTSQPGPVTPPEPQTFKDESQSDPYKALKPIPKTDTQLNSTPAPNLIDPRSRTTLRPIWPAVYHRPAETASQAAADDGWRASRD